MKLSRRNVKVGNVYAILLPNKKYAFGRVFKDCCIGVYNHIGKSAIDLPLDESYQFIVGLYQDVLTSGKWELVGNKKFDSDEDAWPPKMCIIDSISGEYSIYYKGEILPSSEKECEGMEEAAAWEAKHIVDRIMGIDKWHKR